MDRFKSKDCNHPLSPLKRRASIVFKLPLKISVFSSESYIIAMSHKGPVGIKINYHLLTSIYVTSILSYTVLEDDTNDEK